MKVNYVYKFYCHILQKTLSVIYRKQMSEPRLFWTRGEGHELSISQKVAIARFQVEMSSPRMKKDGDTVPMMQPTLATGSLSEILCERVPRTSPAVHLRLIRDGAAGLRFPGRAITSDQTIHKADAVRGRKWKSEWKDIFGRNGWLVG